MSRADASKVTLGPFPRLVTVLKDEASSSIGGLVKLGLKSSIDAGVSSPP
jgi:hypothetical protein